MKSTPSSRVTLAKSTDSPGGAEVVEGDADGWLLWGDGLQGWFETGANGLLLSDDWLTGWLQAQIVVPIRKETNSRGIVVKIRGILTVRRDGVPFFVRARGVCFWCEEDRRIQPILLAWVCPTRMG